MGEMERLRHGVAHTGKQQSVSVARAKDRTEGSKAGPDCGSGMSRQKANEPVGEQHVNRTRAAYAAARYERCTFTGEAAQRLV